VLTNVIEEYEFQLYNTATAFVFATV